MKYLFYSGVTGLILYEIASVYFIMPMPGISQEVNSLDAAYALYSWRWAARSLLILPVLAGIRSAWTASKWLSLTSLVILAAVFYTTHFEMAADTMFYQPQTLSVSDMAGNIVGDAQLVVGICHEGQAKAYPVQFLGYHHQVRDSVGGKPVMVTYCTVCRTGRVYEPVVNGKPERFRLVGMDHFNAMFEDETTKSWWRQATGEAVTGPLKGEQLPEFPSVQTTLKKWKELYPNSLVMQPDTYFQEEYDSLQTYERGRLTGRLTRRDTASWLPKSWIVGVETGNASKAYDWNQLLKERIIHDRVGDKPIVLIMSKDSFSFMALERLDDAQRFTLSGDTLWCDGAGFDFNGKSLDPAQNNLGRVRAYQEYWHSWKTFHPYTQIRR